MMRLTFTLTLISLACTAFSQQFFPYEVPVLVDQQTLDQPWAGGLNKPQFSAIDFNGDGHQDLFIFDREGGAILPFLSTGEPGQAGYTYAPEYANDFPAMRDWALLRDYDQDGVMDIFTNAYEQPPQGIAAYQGSMENGQLSFQRINFPFDFNLLYAQQANGIFLNLYCSFEDIPAIDDIDNDGDLDILAFEPNGIYTYWYRNQSVEKGYGLDTLLYFLEDNCWGGYIEDNFDSDITLADNPGDCGDGLHDPQVGSRHAGSTLLTWDLDGDQDREVLLGDLSNDNMVLLTNGGSPGNDWMNDSEGAFPNPGVPVDMPIFIAGYHLDTDADGRRDFIAAPNSGGLAEDQENVWRYRNTGTEAQPEFTFQQDDFLVGEMIDLGTGAHPAFVDYNADGLLDLVVGNAVVYQEGGVIDPRIYLFENTGALSEPEFELVDDDWLGFSQYGADNRYEFSPTFGDIDDDNDLDLLIGENSGRFYYLENTAGPGNPLAFAAPVYPYAGIDIFNSPIPQIVDINRDGLPDIVAGSRSGFLNYFQNTGTASNPQFNPDVSQSPNLLQLGGVDTRESEFTTRGYSAPAIIDLGGEYEIFCGSYRNGLIRYTDIEGNLQGDFTKVTDFLGNLRLGERLHPALADLNSDGQFDVVIGNRRGGLSLYTTDLKTDGTTPVATPGPQLSFRLYPNPAVAEIQLEFPASLPTEASFTLYSQLGRIVFREKLSQNINRRSLPVGNLPRGLYFWKLEAKDGRIANGKIILQ